MPTDRALFLNAYYSAWSSHWLDHRQLHQVIKESSNVLWIGSYFELATAIADSSWVIVDLDPEMLAIGRQRLPKVLAVQADITRLPFRECFDTIVVLGAVTAYLHNNTLVERAAQSLKAALIRHPSARVLIDAYDLDSIHCSTYFDCRGEWTFADARYTHMAQTPISARSNGVFLSTLTLSKEEEQERITEHFQFYQRAYASWELAESFESQGLRLIEHHADSQHGRFYHTYTHT
ncbi:SAM-dependent methyltransferase [Herbaspirillum rubrisubalbicans]|uniref:class I SAM-dependent methyltransferase n=1 Tax=Herbaspirillum rubrisubalbicans TaxID=80842 RepID=UPI00209E04B4|nr:class I SAM-dependent methyltransferase [Herbaspirillum rubrisubalbicans]MCP1571931.1 SAM-dependent methyltransferase [Herbaspirillum rubrisubalbicans]